MPDTYDPFAFGLVWKYGIIMPDYLSQNESENLETSLIFETKFLVRNKFKVSVNGMDIFYHNHEHPIVMAFFLIDRNGVVT